MSKTLCPDCGMERTKLDVDYCEICRYKFIEAAAAAKCGGIPTWLAVVVVDPTLYTEPDPDLPCPVDEPERTFHLDLHQNLVGRRSDSKRIYPEIPLNDPGISHRHCKFLKESDRIFLLDLGSVNGTRLNDVEAEAGLKLPVKNGDQITLGCWTRITIRCM